MPCSVGGRGGDRRCGPPRARIVVAPDETIYFSDLERIWRIAPDGRLSLARDRRGVHSHALAMTPAGDLLGEDSDYRPATKRYVESIWKLSRSGRLSLVRPPGPTLSRGLGLLRDAAGCTYHSDQAGGAPLLHRACPGRPAERLYGTAAQDRAFTPVLINDIAGTAFRPDGSFLFRHGAAVYRYRRRDGGTVRARGIAAENFGIAVDRCTALFVAEFGRRRVTMAGVGAWGPTGVAVGRRGLYVLEASEHRRGTPPRMRVRRVDPAGRARILATVAIPAT